MARYWILDGKELVPTDHVDVWGRWFEQIDNRRVAMTEVTLGIQVSTVCLGLDHAFGGSPPQLFETMVFGDYDDHEDGVQRRYSTWAQAELGHMELVEELQAKYAPILETSAFPNGR